MVRGGMRHRPASRTKSDQNAPESLTSESDPAVLILLMACSCLRAVGKAVERVVVLQRDKSATSPVSEFDEARSSLSKRKRENLMNLQSGNELSSPFRVVRRGGKSERRAREPEEERKRSLSLARTCYPGRLGRAYFRHRELLEYI